MSNAAKSFVPSWFVRQDIDGFFGLALDNFIQILVILSLCLFVYGAVVFQGSGKPVGVLPENLQTYRDWSMFTSGFLIGGIGGVIFAGFILLEIGRAGIV